MADGTHNEDDGLLIEKCLRRDMEAWASFVTIYSPLIFAAITNRLKLYGFAASEHDVNDIRQQLLMTLWQEGKLAEVKNRGSISYWLAIVAGNAATAHVRRKKNMATLRFVPFSQTIDEEELGEILPSCIPGPRDESACNELADRIAQAIETFPPQEKIILKLHIFHNKKYRDIARILHLPAGTVSSYIKRAKEKLREKLRDFDPDRRNLSRHDT